MKILITNIWLNNFSGSEILSLELYDFFTKNGHDVEIFTNVMGLEMQKFIECENISVSTPNTFAVSKEYDLVWVHHQNIPSEFFHTNPLVGKCIFHHMSPFESLEFTLNADFENQVSDLVLANSSETAEKLSVLGIDMSKVETFNNPAPESFFLFPNEKKSDSYFLFITNHPPVEILQAMEILHKKGRDFRHLGMGSEWAVSRRVVADDLSGASVVISIGKTIQYSIAMRKNFYIYDHFGGDGFISSRENFNDNSYFNFSGRNSRNLKSAEEIVSDLLRFESNNPFDLKYVTEDDLLNFSLSEKVSNLFDRFDFSKKSRFLENVEPKNIEVFQGTLSSLRRSIIQEDNTSTGYRRAIAERDSAIAERDSAIAERDSAIAERDSAIAERDSAIAERDSAIAERDSAIAERDSVLSSKAWQLFEPFRIFRRKF